MASDHVVVFGGTGFLGRRIVCELAAQKMNIVVAARHPSISQNAAAGGGRIRSIAADVIDPSSIARAVGNASAIVNCVSLYVESDDATFQAVHVRGARNVAGAAAKAGVGALVHISGIGSDESSATPYICARGRGEAAVHDMFPDATILRPSVMFGRGDAVLSAIADIAAITPVIPMFGVGDTRLQPVYVDDVAKAVQRAIATSGARGAVYELGGPEIVSYRTLVERVLQWTDRQRILLPFPFFGWQFLAKIAQLLPKPPLTEGQVVLMERDNVVNQNARKFGDLGLTPKAMAEIVPKYLARVRTGIDGKTC
jgi:uncharacterized protein YbjT (DUF2867 family)